MVQTVRYKTISKFISQWF